VLRRLDPAGVPYDGVVPDVELVVRLLHDMTRARAFDRTLLRLARRARIKGYYPSAGQESLAALAPSLTDVDMVFPAYREQPLRLAMGITPAEELAMWAGAPRAPWHPLERGCMPANTAIAAHLPHAVGWAEAQRRTRSGGIAVAVFGDGATSEGDFHAAMNLAGVWRAPVVLVCQNNQYAQTTSLAQQTAAPNLAMKAHGYGVHGVRVDGMDALAVHEAFAEAARRARSGEGATFLELVMYRYSGHSSFEVAPTYRGRDEEARWRSLDPLRRVEALHTALGGDTAAVTAAAVHGLDDEIERACRDVGGQELPSASDLLSSVTPTFNEDGGASVRGLPPDQAAPLTVVAAVAAALHERMASDPTVVVLGEDVATGGGIWGATAGLSEDLPDRVVDVPLNEQGLVGAAVGMALAGLRPVVEIQFAGFVLTALDQLTMQAARYAWRSGGTLRVPLVVRMPAGAGHGGYEGHNEAYESLFTATPGLNVCAPSTPRDAFALTRRAVMTDGPVVVLEPTADYLRTSWGSDAAGEELSVCDPVNVPWGSSRLLHRGDAATVVALGSAVRVADEAAATLADEAIDVDLIDLHDLAPWDLPAVMDSVARTRRLVVVQDAPRRAGFAATVVAEVVERDAALLAASPVRVTQPDLPYGPALLEPVTALTADAVIAAVRQVIRSSTTAIP
jgi:2-oxoisovalerate dehydrogenase E1 component